MPLRRIRPLALIFLILFFFYPALSQQQQQLKKYRILGVSVEGNKTAESETIIAVSGLLVGDYINYPYDEKAKRAVDNLWGRKQFSDVDVTIEKVTADGIFLLIKVKEFPRLNEIHIQNNKEISADEIKKKLGRVKGEIISEQEKYSIRKKLKEIYDEEGLAFAKFEVDFVSFDSAGSGMSDVRIYIDEGTEFYTTHIEFTGNKAFDDSELAGAFDETHTKSWWQVWRSSKFDKKEYKKDLELLTSFYKNQGFMDFKILDDSVEYIQETEEVRISISVQEGEKVYIRDIKFEGNTAFSSALLDERLGFAKGDAYDQEKFQKNLRGNEEFSDAQSLYNNTGYLQLRFVEKIQRVAGDSIDMVITVHEGDRYRIRKVEVVGNTKTKDKVIRRALYTRPGDYFDRSAIIKSMKELNVMGYFNPETLKPDVKPVANDATSVDIVYNVEEKSTDTFNMSMGFAGSFGLTMALGFSFNNFSISEPFKGGAGQIFNFNWEYGYASRLQNFSIGFTEPWFNDSPTTLGFNIFDSRINYSYNLHRTGIGLNIGRRFRWPDDYFRVDWSTRYQINQVDAQLTNYTYYRPGRSTEFTVSQTVSRTSIDDMFFPTQGSRFSLSSTFAMGGIGVGSTDYLKNEMNFDFYSPMMQVNEQNRLVLYIGSRMGYVAGLKSDTTINPLELYRMGGNGLAGIGTIPLRGYTDQSIERDGGRVLAKFIAELRFAIAIQPMPIYAYAFAEAANVWSGFREANPFDLKRSAGMGVQLFMQPFGVIGFSYGYGFDPVKNGITPSGWQFLFHLGQSF